MKQIQALAQKIGWWRVIVTTGCLSGYAPVASGTAGTVVAIPLYIVLVRLGWIPYLAITGLLFLIGIHGANQIEQATDQKDSGLIVIDEIVGFLITMLWVPQQWEFILAGFFAFRLFDIVKPYPIRMLDMNPRLKGFGVMIDDVLAGVYANLALQIVALFMR